MLELAIPPNTISPLTIEVISDDDELSLCGLWLHYAGDNMPCIVSKQKASYTTVNGRNTAAKLVFDSITNFGSPVRVSEHDEARANTLEFMSMIRVSETAQSNKTVRIVLTYGNKQQTMESELFVPINANNAVKSVFNEPKQFIMRDANGSELAYAGQAKLILYDIELEENSQVPLSIVMDSANEYKFCSATFVKIGRNYPCYSSASLKSLHGRLDIGMLCNTYLNSEPDENIVRLAVAVRVDDNVMIGQSFQVASLGYVGKTPYSKKHELVYKVAGNHSSELPSTPLTKGATIHVEARDNVNMRIREGKWIAFNVRIPPFTSGFLTVQAEGEADENRAVVTLHDLRVVSGGSNIPCPVIKNSGQHSKHVHFNSSLPTTQKNIVLSHLGYYSNFGFSYFPQSNRNDSEKLQDDFLRVEVLAKLTDHPAITHDGLYEVHIKTLYGNTTSPIVREGKIKISPVMQDERSPDIDVNIKLKKKVDVLDRGDHLSVTATLRHTAQSSAEPINVALRLFTPNYIELISVEGASTRDMPQLVNDSQSEITDILVCLPIIGE